MTAPQPLPRVHRPTDRAALAAGYRHLADLIETGAAPIPTNAEVSLFVDRGGQQAATARDLMRALGGGTWDKDPDYSPSYLTLTGMVGGLPVRIWLDRDAVCERVVVGSREVVQEIRIGEDTRPVETVTRTEDVVEWRCSPILGAADDTPTVTA